MMKKVISCHRHFLKLSQTISINKSRKKIVQASRRQIEKTLTRFSIFELDLGKPKFKVQGSYSFGTVVLGWAADYDLDLGMYFNNKPHYTPRNLKSKINEIASRITYYGSEDKMKCIQIIFRKEYSIDVPIYYFDKEHNKTFLATKDAWTLSDSIGFDKWIKSRLKGNKQPLRLIKYLKHWASDLSFKCPSGVALTVWIMKHYKIDFRDDVSFIKTLSSIYASLLREKKCIMPVEPYDNLIKKLSSKQISNFLEQLEILIYEGKIALKSGSVEEAVSIWRSNFGEYFPDKI